MRDKIRIAPAQHGSRMMEPIKLLIPVRSELTVLPDPHYEVRFNNGPVDILYITFQELDEAIKYATERIEYPAFIGLYQITYNRLTP